MSYARSRSRIALLNLSFLAGICIACLFAGGSEWMAETSANWPIALSLLSVLGGYVLLNFPFDLYGGYLLPSRHGLTADQLGTWLGKWARGAGIHLICLFIGGYGIILMGQWVGVWGVVGWVAIQMVLYNAFQYHLMMAIAGRSREAESDLGRQVLIVETGEKAFTGGISGLPGQESIVMPAYWKQRFPERVNKVLLARRHGAINTGSHGRGMIAAFIWNLLFSTVAILLSHASVGTLAGWIEIICYFSLFSLLTLGGFLPRLSRRAVWEVDRWIFYKGFDADGLRESFSLTGRLQAETQPQQLETWFQPLPDAENRQQQFAQQTEHKGAWHATIQAIFLSWAGGNLLARSGRTALGRPALWVFLPGD